MIAAGVCGGHSEFIVNRSEVVFNRGRTAVKGNCLSFDLAFTCGLVVLLRYDAFWLLLFVDQVFLFGGSSKLDTKKKKKIKFLL